MEANQLAVRDFSIKFGALVNTSPTSVDPSIALLRITTLASELGELADAIRTGDLEGVADALVDIEYFVKGTALAYGLDLQEFFDAVHAANMEKHAAKDPGGKITKPPGWKPADIAGILQRQIARGQKAGA